MIQGIPAESFLLERRCIVLSNVDSRIAPTDPKAEGVQKTTVEVAYHGKHQGDAVALSHDGYMLTTPEAIDSKEKLVVLTNSLVLGTDHALPEIKPVFSSKSGELKFAVVHLDREIKTVSEWSDRPPSVGELVFVRNNSLNKMAAGHITQVKRIATNDGYEHCEIQHDAPLRQEDLSSPLFSAEGKLIGINSNITLYFGVGGSTHWGDRKCVAIRPDPNYVTKLIAEHRAKMLAQKPLGSVSPVAVQPAAHIPTPTSATSIPLNLSR